MGEKNQMANTVVACIKTTFSNKNYKEFFPSNSKYLIK